MERNDRYIPGVPCWIDTTQPDPDTGAAFYAELFGWELEDRMPPGAPGKYYVARIRGEDVGAVSSQPEGAPEAAVWNTYVWVEDADETADKVRTAGGTVLTEPFDVPGAGRMATFADPEGAAFCVWQAKEHRGAAVVNEHGSLNFNNLSTRDLEGAQAFYGAVFGWEAIHDAMWALPGYGDFLEQRNPGMREGMADMGAPAIRGRGRERQGHARRRAALGRDLRRRRRRRDRSPGRRAGRDRGRPAVRRPLGADDGHQ